MKEEAKVNYAFALKNHQQKGWGRSMKKFCDEGGYDYEKFMQYSRQGQKEYSVLKEASVFEVYGWVQLISLKLLCVKTKNS